MRTYNSFKFEMYKIKKQYCKKCIYFDKENFKCSKDKVYTKCIKNNERIIKKEEENEWYKFICNFKEF